MSAQFKLGDKTAELYGGSNLVVQMYKGSTLIYDLPSYTIKFVDADGNVLQESKVHKGVTPTYSGSTPTKTSTAQYTYEWNNGWDKTIVAANEDTTYTAQFTSTLRKYVITWSYKNSSGTQTTTTEVYYGNMPTAPSISSYTTYATATHTTYTFSSWSPTITTCTGATTYTAQYSSSTDVNSYTLHISVYGSSYISSYSVKRTSSPNKGASTGTLSDGATIYYGDVLTKSCSAKSAIYGSYSYNPSSITKPSIVTYGSGTAIVRNYNNYTVYLYSSSGSSLSGTGLFTEDSGHYSGWKGLDSQGYCYLTGTSGQTYSVTFYADVSMTRSVTTYTATSYWDGYSGSVNQDVWVEFDGDYRTGTETDNNSHYEISNSITLE